MIIMTLATLTLCMNCLWHEMTTGPLLCHGLQRQIAPSSAFDLIQVCLTKSPKSTVLLCRKTAGWPQYDDLLSTREPGTWEVTWGHKRPCGGVPLHLGLMWSMWHTPHQENPVLLARKISQAACVCCCLFIHFFEALPILTHFPCEEGLACEGASALLASTNGPDSIELHRISNEKGTHQPF